MNSDKMIFLSEEGEKTILEIERNFKEIQNNCNTSNALDYLQEIIDYLRNTYNVN